MSYRKRTKRSALDQALNFYWGVWSELGVSGWGRTHTNWGIDPEPLIIYTAALGDADPRLRDEATDWCVHYSPYVSRVRLRNLLRDQTVEFLEHWGEFAATVNARAGVNWPRAQAERSGFRVTGRSALRSLSEPSLVSLRFRALFGIAARTEILRYLLFHTGRQATVAVIADATAYTKRIVADECEGLERAGALSMRVVGNRFYYSLARSSALEKFVGDLPAIFPDWCALLHLVKVLIELEEASEELPHDLLVIEGRRALRRIENDLEALDIEGPANLQGPAFVSEMLDWTRAIFGELAKGKWPGGHGRSEQVVRPRPIRNRRAVTAPREA